MILNLPEGNVYSAYEEAVLEYSYLVNLHQTKNAASWTIWAPVLALLTRTAKLWQEILFRVLTLLCATLSLIMGMFAEFRSGLATEAGFGGTLPIYSASVEMIPQQQDYDLQTLISASAATDTAVPYYDQVKGKRIVIRKVFFKTPRAMWRFYGYYGGFSVVGNLRTYGQYADDSTFEIVPTWQNKLQAMAYEDAMWTRISHYSYEIHDNMLRIFPEPDSTSPDKYWVQFTIERQFEPWEDSGRGNTGAEGINNMNTLPFENIPFENINSIGKQWVRRFALALTKEMLGQVRGKFATVPIPGESVTLNASELLSQARTEQDQLRTELKTILEDTTYDKLAAIDSSMQDSAKKVLENIPAGIYVG